MKLRCSFCGKDQHSVKTLFKGLTQKESLVTVYILGTQEAVLNSACHMYGTIVAPNARVRLDGASQLYGTCIASEIVINSESEFHHDVNPNVGVATGSDGDLIVQWQQP